MVLKMKTLSRFISLLNIFWLFKGLGLFHEHGGQRHGYDDDSHELKPNSKNDIIVKRYFDKKITNISLH